MEMINLRQNCIYCGAEIKESSEHIIQNAIGGLLESSNICCKKCNNGVCSKIDIEFTSIFNAIISKIPNMEKSNNRKSKPKCTGKAICDGILYDVIIKGDKVVACPELSKKEKCDVSHKKFEIIAYDFPIENRRFRDGFGKIALNFALSQGIEFEDICSGVHITKNTNNEVEKIRFDYIMFPFVPLNTVDEYLELENDMELYHNLILFSQGTNLWCYIDLFNTFQYYVLLSDKWDKPHINKNYLQLIQRLNRDIPEIHIRKPKHILMYADFYRIEPTLDVKLLKKRIAEAVRLSSNKISMKDKISEKFSGFIAYCIERYGTEKENLIKPLSHVMLYFDEDDKLNENMFRTTIFLDFEKREVTSYPLLLMKLIKTNRIDPKKYTFAKFDKLNHLLISNLDKDDSIIE